ncbi:MAG: hypothetical protein ACFFDN_20635, partial [Candidatus Hodarchaeota archaeon]
MSTAIYDIVKNISGKMGQLVGVKVYVAVTSKDGNFIYSDEVFDDFKAFIKKFVETNFVYLQKGEHSIPLSSENIIFFKTTENSMTILYNPKGKIGQLLAFKSMMNNFCEPIENCITTQAASTVEVIEETAAAQLAAQKMEEIGIVTRKDKHYNKIRPILRRSLKKKDKFNLVESTILNRCDGNNTLQNIIRDVDINDSDVIKSLHKFAEKKLIGFEDYELFHISCPECKNSVDYLIPKFMIEKSQNGIRVQLFPEGCNHTFIAFIDKKLKIKTKIIEKLLNFEDSLDLRKLTIEKLITFFGQDVFFNIFHAIFFRFYTVFIGEEEIINIITEFLRKIFTQLEYGRHIFAIDQAEFEKNTKKYKEFLVIDFNSNTAIDPYEEEEEIFDFEFKLFKNVLQNPD